MNRREFLDRSGRIALGVGGVQLARANAGAARALGEQATRSGTHGSLQGRALALSNDSIGAEWTIADNSIRPSRFIRRMTGAQLPVSGDLFSLTIGETGGPPIAVSSTAFRIVGDPRVEAIAPNRNASRLAERVPGRQAVATLRDADGRLEVEWRAELRDDSSYVRQTFMFRPLSSDVPIRELSLLAFDAPKTWVPGTVRGTPIVLGDDGYVAFEHPLANNAVDGDRVRCRMARTLPLRRGTTLEASSVIGARSNVSLRRDFLSYVERERAHPYRTFLHYNSWYDIGYFSKYSEADAIAAIDFFGRELHEKRGVVLDSFLFDDGWDDPTTLWRFNSGFSNGFTKVREAAQRYGAAPGVWMSPWGGYGKPHDDRVAYGKAQGFETNARGFALSGPVYYERFRDTCLDMIRRYGVNQFKFDGTGNAASTVPNSRFDSDFDAAIHLIGELRAEKPDLYVNLTTGTYPSPFWLRYADSIWRGGEDHDFAGVGTSRQRWITYRDADVYEHVVRAGALFPLNSLMLHGMIYARSAHNLMTDPKNDFTSEVRDYFGTGTQLQEMYITPALLSSENWDTIAECAKWSRANAGTLVDTHWVGGDPLRLEPYGWASWSPAKGILTLRNPSETPKSIEIDVGDVFELPSDARTVFTARSRWKVDGGNQAMPPTFRAGQPIRMRLDAFQVLTLEMSSA